MSRNPSNWHRSMPRGMQVNRGQANRPRDDRQAIWANLLPSSRFGRELRIEALEPRCILSGLALIQPGIIGPIENSLPAIPPLASGVEPTGSTTPPAGALSPQQIRAAYGVNLLSQEGSNQTIAIIDAYDDPDLVDSGGVANTTGVNSSSAAYNASDLHNFDAYYGLPDFGLLDGPTFTKLDENGGTNYPVAETPGSDNWEGEEALDVEWAHAIAPAANIVLIEANSNSYTDLMTAVNTARNILGVSVISMSFEESESDLLQSGINPANFEQYLTTPSGHTGVTFVASTGDAGSPSGFPAESPNVLAVGGTTLTLDGTNYQSEAGWTGSGGGISSSVPQPIYQQGLVIHNGSSIVNPNGFRAVPDVAFDADPNSGVAVYDSFNGGSSPWVQLGGTSIGAPCWAGLIALADQMRVSVGMGTLDGPSKTLPTLYSLPSSDFHDISSGSSGGNPQYTAGSAYNLVTGLGSPVANLLVPELSGTIALTPPTLPDDTVNVAYNQALSASGGSGNITLTVSNIDNPIPGLVLPASGSNSLSISGTPTATGTETFMVTATDALGDSTSSSYSITVNGPVTLSPLSPGADQINVTCNQTLSASGGTGDITLVVSNIQNAVAGIVLPASGSDSLAISGTPTAMGTETFTVTATDSLGASTTTSYSIIVENDVALGPATLPADTVNAPYNHTLTASGGTGNLTLVVSNIQNPIAGLVVPASGNGSISISGTPTAAGNETFTVTAIDALGAITSINYTIRVDGAITLSLPADTINVPYNQTLTASGGAGSVTLTVSSIQNPIAGLIVPASGSNNLTISGVPISTGTEIFTVTATDSAGDTTSTNYSILINGAVKLVPAALPEDTIDVAYDQTFSASGGTGNITFVVSDIQNAIAGLILPAIGSNSLSITGTPTATGTETFTIIAIDTLGASTSINYSITVNGAVVLTPATLPADTLTVAYDHEISASGGTGAITFTVSNIQNAIAGLVVPASGSNGLTISGTPTAAGIETFTVTATDTLGAATSAIYSITVNALPVLSGIEETTLTFAENGPATAVTATITVSDSGRSTLAGATVWISGNYQDGQDVLSFTNTANITASWNAATGTLTLTGSDTLADYQLALRAVMYQDTSANPSTALRTVSFLVSDGLANSNTIARQLTVANVASSISDEIVDNSQPGFWSTSNSTWSTTASGLNGSSLLSSTPNGSEESQAAWWFSMPAGVYEISITYTAGVNLTKDLGLDIYDGVGNWIGEIPVNEQIAPSSFTEDGVAWENLGAFKISSNVFHISTWNSSSDGAISINGIQLQAAPVVDDSNVLNGYSYYPPATSVGSFTSSGAWTSSTQGAFGGSHTSSSTAGSGSSVATWTMPDTPGIYEVDVTWPASANLSANVTYNVFDGSTKIASVAIDQQVAPNGVSYDGLNWQSLGRFTTTGTKLSVTVANTSSDGQVSADAIRILPNYQPTPIVDEGYPGFWSNTAWTTENTGLYGQSLLSSSANGSEQSQAAWWFPVQPGQYQIYATWVPGNNLTSTAPFDIYNATSYLSEELANERLAPAGVTDQGMVWQSLGTFTITSNVLHISTWNSQTNGAMCVDGVRIVPIGTSS